MSGCCVGWSGNEGRTRGGRVFRRSRMAFTGRTDGRTRTDGLAKAGDEVEKEGRAKKGTTRRKRSERSERERGLDLDVIPLGRSVGACAISGFR